MKRVIGSLAECLAKVACFGWNSLEPAPIQPPRRRIGKHSPGPDFPEQSLELTAAENSCEMFAYGDHFP